MKPQHLLTIALILAGNWWISAQTNTNRTPVFVEDPWFDTNGFLRKDIDWSKLQNWTTNLVVHSHWTPYPIEVYGECDPAYTITGLVTNWFGGKPSVSMRVMSGEPLKTNDFKIWP